MTLTRALTKIAGLTVAAALFVAPAASAATPHDRASVVKAHIALVKKRSRPHVSSADTCENTDVVAARANLGEIADALICLHNQVRSQAGLPQLKENARLRRAAKAHSSEMVSKRFFDHTNPDGTTFAERLMSAGYAKRSQGWVLGENLAWGTSTLSTAGSIMNAWMHSPEHKANILKRSYREIGIGVVSGVPTDPDAGATVTAEFGVIR